jgi:AraC-like DNA-binding protein
MQSDGIYISIEEITLAHEFTIDAAHKCEYPLGRGQYGIVFGLEGELEYRFRSGDRVTIGPSDLVLLRADAAYSTHPKHSFLHYTVNFDINRERSCGEILQKEYCLFHVDASEECRQLLKKLTSLRLSKRAGADMLCMSCLYELLALVLAQSDSTERDLERQARLLPAKEYIDKNPTEPISLEYLAHLSRMSITNFRREWSKIYSETPMQYRDRVRIFYAKEYLGSGYYTVSEVAYRCGFDDVSYFIRFFKKHTGISPKKFKDRE